MSDDEEFLPQARMICAGQFKKSWHAATEEQRRKSLEIAREVDVIGRWPSNTHLPDKADH